MRLPTGFYQLVERLGRYLPSLRAAQVMGLALWVYGYLLADRAGESRVVAALSVFDHPQNIRARLREWLADGAHKRRVCTTQVDPSACFLWLLLRILSLWQSDRIALAVDVTTRKDELTLIVVSVLYRNSALPVAWHVLEGNKPGGFLEPIAQMLSLLAPALRGKRTVVLCDRGLWSRTLFEGIRKLGMHPLMRAQNDILFRPAKGKKIAAIRLLHGPGSYYVGEGKAFKNMPMRSTLVAIWAVGYKEPSLVLTDLNSQDCRVFEYEMRFWIEMGFRTIKLMGADWERTRRTDLMRASRHLLVVAVAFIEAAATGTRQEDARLAGIAPEEMIAPMAICYPMPVRKVNLISAGIIVLRFHLARGHLWHQLWLLPMPDGPDIHLRAQGVRPNGQT